MAEKKSVRFVVPMSSCEFQRGLSGSTEVRELVKDGDSYSLVIGPKSCKKCRHPIGKKSACSATPDRSVIGLTLGGVLQDVRRELGINADLMSELRKQRRKLKKLLRRLVKEWR
jgi:hypothetical protein